MTAIIIRRLAQQMVQAISKQIVSLTQVHEIFGLRRAESDRFFTEWREDLAHLSAEEKARLDQIKQRYDYNKLIVRCLRKPSNCSSCRHF